VVQTPPFLLTTLAIGALCGCATSAQSSRQDWLELRAELRALREHSAELEQRLARLEDRSEAKKLSLEREHAVETLPSLTVVKLKPKREAAPSMSTKVAVVEPPVEVIEDLSSPSQSNAAEAVGDVPPEDPAILEVKYQEAVTALRVGNVEGGANALEQFARAHPKHPRADNALYFAGVGRIGLKDFAGAAKLLEELLKRYPAGDAVQDGMLKLAECRVRLRQGAQARSLYANIVASYPGTAAATQAEQELSSLSR
jgi:TolA-binding protein